MPLPDAVAALVERFDEQHYDYKRGIYNETQVRREFIDPFFKALGWDVDNERGYAEAYKEVVHESDVRVKGGDEDGQRKAPDYAFRIGGVRKFFVEAKKPSVNIKGDLAASFQVRRYAWSDPNVKLAILTDFEEFAVYDGRVRPHRGDGPSTARIFYCSYRQYAEHWDHISGLFSIEAIQHGAFDRFADDNKRKRGTEEPGDAFLKEIESWRELLAGTLARTRPDLSARDLGAAVQRIIDRIIFLRIAEDRQIEPYGELREAAKGKRAYPRLVELFREADARYNSGLFHFGHEKGRAGAPDTITPGLDIPDRIIKPIIQGLYYPDSPYAFEVLPADLLGQVYERFLGKVIRLQGRRAIVEEKPEVKKAGGVYYTPTYIVNYIVKQTLGPLLDGRTPKTAEGLSVLDPACGSGSFLLGALDFLLEWYLNQYTANNPGSHARGRNPRLVAGPGGDWRLTVIEKKRILLGHIFGVDIDPQAVEVTKLSLLLRLLEGETAQTVDAQHKLLRERILPELAENIKCGNSLVGPDFYDGRDTDAFGDEDHYRINAFDWAAEFSVIMRRGGFDGVIGNPPYGATFDHLTAEYFSRRYSLFRGVQDVYTLFIERSVQLARSKGYVSFIVPSAWMGGPAYLTLRDFLLDFQLQKLVLLPFDVFKDAYVDTVIFALSKADAGASHQVRTFAYPAKEGLKTIGLSEADYGLVGQQDWRRGKDRKIVLDVGAVMLIERLRASTRRVLGDVFQIRRGILFDKALLAENQEKRTWPYFDGDVYRYEMNYSVGGWLAFDDRLKERPKETHWFEGPRLLLRRLVNRRQRLMSTYTDQSFLTNKNLYSVLAGSGDIQIKAILGILNSRLISYLYVNQVTQAKKDDFPQVTIRDTAALPFPGVATSEHDRLVALVTEMLDLHRRRAGADGHTRTLLDRRIATTDRAIDALVYELYGLSRDEIALVEAATP